MSFPKVGDDYDSILNFPSNSVVKNLPVNIGDTGLIPGLGRPLEKGTATHSSILASRILWTEEPGRLQSMGSQKVRQDCNWAHGSILMGLSMYLSDHLRMPANTSLMVLWKGAPSMELKPLANNWGHSTTTCMERSSSPVQDQIRVAPTDNLTTVSWEIFSQNKPIKPLLDSWLSGDVTQKQTASAPSFDLHRDEGICRVVMKVFWSLRPSPEELLLEPQAEPRGLSKVLQRSITTWLRSVPLNPPCTSSHWPASLGLHLEAAFNCFETESCSKPSNNRNKGVWHGGNKNILFIYTSAMENNMKTCCNFLNLGFCFYFFFFFFKCKSASQPKSWSGREI